MALCCDDLQAFQFFNWFRHWIFDVLPDGKLRQFVTDIIRRWLGRLLGLIWTCRLVLLRLSRSMEMVSMFRMVLSSALGGPCAGLVPCLALRYVVCVSWLKVVWEQTRASRRCTWTKLPSICRSSLTMRWLVLKCITTWGSGGKDEWGYLS
jgi:hypothetical protein